MFKEILTEIDENALCNDGTSAIYYWKKSPKWNKSQHKKYRVKASIVIYNTIDFLSL